jgi:3-methyladenine DNA glycosylase/8-oxoguanine DNA glycosylase
MRGVKPPRYPTLWEACVNAVLFQQLSLIAASAISRRMVMALSGPAPWRGTALYKFPAVETFQDASDDVLLAAGLSANKLGTLRRVADALRSGVLDEASLRLTGLGVRCYETTDLPTGSCGSVLRKDGLAAATRHVARSPCHSAW